MQTVTLEPLRWRDPPARAAVTIDGAAPRVRLQSTAPREIAAMCVGRPAEELPRIVSILSPAHHLCAARALDRLFGVEPPPCAANAREALRLALVCRQHLRKFQFLVSSVEDPFGEFRPGGAPRAGPRLRPVLDDVAAGVALAGEAATILGGRADHPVTAVAGGVTRVLKPEHHARLGEIAASLRGAAERAAAFLRERVLVADDILGGVRALDAGPIASLALARDGAVVLRDGGGAEVERFAAAELFAKIALRREGWSHEPFAYFAARGWDGVEAAGGGAFFVGPLARLAGGEPLSTPLAEAERQRLVAALGAFPRLDVAAAWWALAVELLAAAEGLAALSDPELLSGPAPRAVPSARGAEGHAAIESPAGVVAIRLRADARGLVDAVDVLDAAAANNALAGIVARRAVEAALAERRSWEETKRRLELALLAW